MTKIDRLFLSLFIFLFMIVFSPSRLYAQVGIEFTFANPVISNIAGVDYLDFDIMAHATANSQFKIAQIYINYNTAAFGSSLVANGNVTITKGTGSIIADKLLGVFLSDDYALGQYVIMKEDNTPAILTISNTFSYSTNGTYVGNYGYELSNTLGTTPVRYMHIRMRIQNTSQLSGISFNTLINQWDLQDYYYTTPFTDAQTIYIPVIETSTLDIPLPVELTSFTAKTSGNEVLLNWETKTEINNYGFEIERASSSTSPDQGWAKVGFIEGNGSSNSPKEYSYIDKDVQSGNYYYRLKQIDNDGQFEFSPEVSVTVSAPKDYNLAQNFPNPFNPATTINFTIPEDGFVKLSVYNLLGQEIRTLVEEQRQAGSYKESFDAKEINSGVYFYELKVNNFVQTKKMQYLK